MKTKSVVLSLILGMFIIIGIIGTVGCSTGKEEGPDAESEPYPMADPSSYPLGSPEMVFAEYLVAWKNKDWNRMLQCTRLSWRNRQKEPVEVIKLYYGLKALLGAKIIDTDNASNVSVDITAGIYYKQVIGSKAVQEKSITARLIRESAVGQPSQDGEWRIDPLSTLKEE